MAWTAVGNIPLLREIMAWVLCHMVRWLWNFSAGEKKKTKWKRKKRKEKERQVKKWVWIFWKKKLGG